MIGIYITYLIQITWLTSTILKFNNDDSGYTYESVLEQHQLELVKSKFNASGNSFLTFKLLM